MDKNLLIEKSRNDVTNLIYDDLDCSGEILHGDDGATLVIKKSLLTPKGDSSKDWWCTSIFHSICTIRDKVYNLIIGNGNCESIVSTKMWKSYKKSREPP